MKKEKIRDAVRDHYASVAEKETPCCGAEIAGPEAENIIADADSLAKEMGYGNEELAEVPDGANLGLGCGNPIAIAGLSEGETVLDLGSGAGFDAFIAARKIGKKGRVIGVDMTDEMLGKARANAKRGGFDNVEFRKGQIEKLPVESDTVDVVISNCVVNLSPDKQSVFNEAFRALKPGGRLEISDVIAREELGDALREDLKLVSCCIGGAATDSKIVDMLTMAGFVDVRIEPKDNSGEIIDKWGIDEDVRSKVLSAYIRARKPGGGKETKSRCCG